MKKFDTNSNVYTVLYATVLVVIVALLLAVVSGALKPRQDANVLLDQKKQILASLNERNLKDARAEQLYSEQVREVREGELVWYEATVDGAHKYVLPMRGAGLWGPIWGYMALNEDKNEVFGTYFGHESETPGLGGEIVTEAFQKSFNGKHVLDADGQYVGIALMKSGQTADGQDQVDCISGATITSKGVETMLRTAILPYAEAGWFGAQPEEEAPAQEEVEPVTEED